jgi:hypothetical protein
MDCSEIIARIRLIGRHGYGNDWHASCARLSEEGREYLLWLFRCGYIRIGAYDGRTVRSFEWWGRAIFQNTTDGGYVRISQA